MEENLSETNPKENPEVFPESNLPGEEIKEEGSNWDKKKIAIFVSAIIGIILLVLAGILVLLNRSREVNTTAETAEKTATGFSTDLNKGETNEESSENAVSQTGKAITETQTINQIFTPKTDGSLKIVVPVEKTVFSELPGSFSKVEKEKLLLVEIDSMLSGFDNMQSALKAALNSLPSEMASGLSAMELYIFKGANDFGPGEAILLRNNLSAEENWTLARKNEPTMINDWKNFILIGEKSDIVAAAGPKEFINGTTDKTRYVNFTNDGAVSLDYSAGNGYLLFANSYSIKKRILEGNTL